MSHLGENIRAFSMESVHFIIKGCYVGSTAHGADTRTILILTAPLTLGAGAANKAQSVHPWKLISKENVVNANITWNLEEMYQVLQVLEYDSPDLYDLPLCKQGHWVAGIHPLCLMSSKTVPLIKDNDRISPELKVNCTIQSNSMWRHMYF